MHVCGPGSSVGIATELRAGRSGIESRWGRHFPPVQTGPGAHPASCTMGTWLLVFFFFLSFFLHRALYEGESNEILKSALKIRNTARLSCKLTTMILMV